MKKVKQEIRQKWQSGKDPISFAGISAIKRKYPQLKKEDIKDALGGLDTYTLFREEKKPKTFNPIYVRQKRELMQSDLIDLTALEKENDGVKFLLVVIDTFTRFAWIEPLQNKSAKEVLSAFKEIVGQMKHGFGGKLMTDQGKEYINQHFQKFLKDKNISFVIPNHKCPHVERFNRTFQNMLYRYMEERQTERYIDSLPMLLNTYNNRYHRIIKMSPRDAEMNKNFNKVLSAVEMYYKKAETSQKRIPKFSVGDLVRISAHKTLFRKGYYQSFKPKIYVISHVLTNLPVPMYKIAEKGGKSTGEAGTWYANELTLVSKDYKDSVFKIEKVIKTKGTGTKKQMLVKWKYWPDEYNSWVKASDVEKL